MICIVCFLREISCWGVERQCPFFPLVRPRTPKSGNCSGQIFFFLQKIGETSELRARWEWEWANIIILRVIAIKNVHLSWPYPFWLPPSCHLQGWTASWIFNDNASICHPHGWPPGLIISFPMAKIIIIGVELSKNIHLSWPLDFYSLPRCCFHSKTVPWIFYHFASVQHPHG